MKRIKFLLVFVFLLVGTLTVVGFSSEKYHRSVLALECLRYVGPSYTTPAEIALAANWTSMFPNPLSICLGGEKLCAICFDNSQLSPNEARQILVSYYFDHGELPPVNGYTIYGYGSDWNDSINVYLKE